MGLDIAFNRQAALAAGIRTKDIPNGHPANIEDVREQVAQGAEDPDYLRWLEETASCVQVPGMEYWVEDDASGPGPVGDFIVRANKLGSTYGPLTAWLEANSISWTEF